MRNLELLAEWNAAKTKLEAAKKEEARLRIACAEEIFGYDENQLQTGTVGMDLPNNYKAKLVFKVNTTLNQDRNEVGAAMDDLAAMGVDDETLVGLFSYKIALVQKVYKKLSPAATDRIDSLLSRKPGMPTLSIVAPK